MMGMAIICAGVVCVGIKDEQSDSKNNNNISAKEVSVEWQNLMIAIGYALATGLCYSLNSVIMRYYVRNVGFTVVQLNIDAMGMLGFFLLVMFCVTPVSYSIFDVLLGTVIAFLSLLGTLCVCHAL